MRKFLFVVVLAVLAWIFVVPSCSTKFGCDAAPAAAHAADAECPSDVEQAADDAAWAADRLDSIKDEHVTTGLFYDEDGHRHDFVSGRDDDAERAVEVGRDAGVFPDKGRPVVVDHVEVKVAAAMRAGEVMAGVLVINNVGGPCKLIGNDQVAPMSCQAIMPGLLPPTASLTVWWADEQGRIRSLVFSGGAE